MQVKTVNGKRYYEDDSGRLYPSVTTVLEVIRSPWLEQWRGNLGNYEADRRRDEAGDIGTEVHRLCGLINICHDTVMGKPGNAIMEMVGGYLKWFRVTVEQVLAVETPVFSKTYGYAGTFDLLAVLKGDQLPTIIDIKTSGAFYPSMALQLAAYRQALMEAKQLPVGLPTVSRRLVVRVDKASPGLVEVKEYTNHSADFNGFVCALGLWKWLEGK